MAFDFARADRAAWHGLSYTYSYQFLPRVLATTMCARGESFFQ